MYISLLDSCIVFINWFLDKRGNHCASHICIVKCSQDLTIDQCAEISICNPAKTAGTITLVEMTSGHALCNKIDSLDDQ